MYQIVNNELIELVEKRIVDNLNDDNILDIFNITVEQNSSYLKESCEIYIKNNKFQLLLKQSEKLLNWKRENFEYLMNFHFRSKQNKNGIETLSFLKNCEITSLITKYIKLTFDEQQIPQKIEEYKRQFGVYSRLELYQKLPSGITIGNNSYGKCLIATKQFKKDCLIYYGETIIVSEEIFNHYGEQEQQKQISQSNNKQQQESKFRIFLEDKVFEFDRLHSVQVNHFQRQLYGFDGFTNHSCDPNSYTICDGRKFEHSKDQEALYNDIDDYILHHKDTDREDYYIFATKDIQIGDEITCDYAAFDYSCEGHEIEKCLCGSEICRGLMRGFKGMTIEQQVKLLPRVYSTVIQDFLTDQKGMFEIVDLESQMPSCIEIKVKPNDELCTISKQKLLTGDTLYKNKIQICTNFDKKHCLKINNNLYKLLENDKHYIHRGDYREMVGFESFINHSCYPNVERKYTSKDEDYVFALKEINIGDEISVDYRNLKNQFSNSASLKTLKFKCSCGSTNCAGIIEA